MAGPYYVDPAAGGSNNGSDWANAWTSLQSAADTAAAGEVVYCRGTQTLSGAQIDFDTNAGTNAAGWIKFIGYNSSGNVDGTRFIIDANAGSHDCIKFTSTAKMVWFENIECKNTGTGTYHGFNASSYDSAGCVFVNCCANGCSAGWSSGSFSNSIYYRCVAYSNRGSGFVLSNTSRIYLSCARDNTDDGFNIGGSMSYCCVSHSNTEEGFANVTSASTLINCVSDHNADDGIEIANYTSLFGAFILACRVTNHSGAGDVGLKGAADGNDEPFITALCYFEDNDTDISDATLHQNIPLENSATSSNAADTPDTNAGYVNETESTAGTTNLSTNYVSGTDPTLRRTAVTIPFD